MEEIIKKYRDRIWRVVTGEGVECAFSSDLKDLECELNAFAVELIRECGACMSQPEE